MPKTATRKKPAATENHGAAALRALNLPPLGIYWAEEEGVFVGIRKHEGGEIAVVVPTDPASDIDSAPWKDAITKASAFKTKDHQDFVAADRFDLALAYMNAPELFKKNWYWSATPYAGLASYAWVQSFDYGLQYGNHKGGGYRARAVRRVKI